AIPAASADELFGGLAAVVGNDDRADDTQLDVVESRAGPLTDPSDLLSDGFRQEPRRVRGVPPARKRRGLQADDTRLTRGNREHPTASRADQYRWVWPLRRFGKRVQVRHRVEAAGEREWCGAEQPFEDLERLRQAVDTHAGWVIRQPAGLVFRSREAGPEPQLEPTAGQQVDPGALLRDPTPTTPVIAQQHPPTPHP